MCPGYERLSPRERAAYALLVQGATNKEIGRELHLTEQTVKNHITAIMHKVGSIDRVQLTAAHFGGALYHPLLVEQRGLSAGQVPAASGVKERNYRNGVSTTDAVRGLAHARKDAPPTRHPWRLAGDLAIARKKAAERP